MAKKLVTIRLAEEAITVLKQMAADQDRSEAYIIEKLLLSVKTPAPPIHPSPTGKRQNGKGSD